MVYFLPPPALAASKLFLLNSLVNSRFCVCKKGSSIVGGWKGFNIMAFLSFAGMTLGVARLWGKIDVPRANAPWLYLTHRIFIAVILIVYLTFPVCQLFSLLQPANIFHAVTGPGWKYFFMFWTSVFWAAQNILHAAVMWLTFYHDDGLRAVNKAL